MSSNKRKRMNGRGKTTARGRGKKIQPATASIKQAVVVVAAQHAVGGSGKAR
jgi:hypothetical protein